MLYPSDLPVDLLSYFYLKSEFFFNEASTRLNRHQYKVYLESLLHREVNDHYEALFRAAILQNIPEVISLISERDLTKYSFLTESLRELIHPENLSKDCALSLLLGPAHIDNATIDWEKQLLGEASLIQEQYEHTRDFNLLVYWWVIDSQSALEALSLHPIPREKIILLILHGDAQLLAQHAHQLVTIPYSEVYQALNLFFNKQLITRSGLSDEFGMLYEVADPVFIQQLLASEFNALHPYLLGKKRTPELIQYILNHCSGTVLNYFRLYANHNCL